MKRYFDLFCQNSSLIGVGRLTKPNYSTWLRILWLTFIGSMITILIQSTIESTEEYLAYNTIVQTNVEETSLNPFPTMTICATHPFDKEAVAHWNSGRVLSPAQFNHNLRLIAKHYFEKGEVDLASAIFYFDQVSIYYQNLTAQEAYDLSYKPESLLLYCHLLLQTGQQWFNSNFSECLLDVTHVSHPKYFNCFSVTVKEKFRNEVKHVSVMVHVNDLNDASLHPAAFIQDVFNQVNGLRIIIHEPHLRPDVENDGIHVEAGSVTEVIYQLEEWRKVSTPKDQCVHSKEYFFLTDLEDSFGYDSKMCIDRKVNQLVAERCKCQLSYLPRVLMPSDVTPYCGQISFEKMKNLINRLSCVNQMNLTEMRNQIRKFHCKPRCHFHRYLTKVSSTKWHPNSWQLYWLIKVSAAYWNLHGNANLSSGANYSKDIHDYFSSENLQSRSSNIMTNGLHQYSMITIRNTDEKTIIKEEIAQLTLSGLFSRIGGLCSLYLGLTCSFIIEIIEFLVLSKKMAKQSFNLKNAKEDLITN